MDPTVSDRVARFATAIGPQPDEVISEMDAHAEEQNFPHVGPAVGGWLSLLVRTTGAKSVFEFGSGFGYSAYWFARELPSDGEIVLTDLDPDNLEQAREYLDRGGYLDQATIEAGDAIDTVKQYDGPFDIVLIDNEKHRYREAFEAVREKVSSGGLIVADNAMTSGAIEFDALAELVDGADTETTESTRGMADYLRTVNDDPAFETALLPLGEGVAVSHKR
ncbi:O-methyltransferase [Halocatena pleomorpha]|uniref:O-methyltransferase n=1 Tax=Halocatena pleomorpha TaxID=1785090 RepID=A0A3P3R2W8_9EURY|nr:O-methyltransferase [Halocatena pleomorpha]RRJ27822.1 O-methyltransferase [Halocatena pleomorpha]